MVGVPINRERGFMKIIEPLTDKIKLKDQIITTEAKRVMIIFWHGLGDLIMFLNPYAALKAEFPEVHFDLAVQKGLSFEDIVPKAVFVTGDDISNESLEKLDYDIIAKVHFPMNEGQTEYTKGEWCCIHELGTEPTNGHHSLYSRPNKLIGIHYQITCLPDSYNPDKETAEKVWNEVLEAGYIPIETHFEHAFHNPVNKKFDFIDASVRRVTPRVNTLIGLLQNCAGFIGVVSGNLHVALAALSPKKVMLLEKHFKLECFTHLPVARATILPGKYKEGSVKKWLNTLI